MLHRDTTETFYKLRQIVCVKADSIDTRQLFIMACLQENVSVGMKMVKAKMFIQDPFNPMLFTEDAERYVDVSNIVCALTCYNYRKDTLEVEEDDLILLLDVPHHTNEVVTVTEAAKSVEMIETAVDEVWHERIPRRRKRWFKSNFFFYSVSRKVKQANKYGDNDKYFGGSREQRQKISGSREHELKTFWELVVLLMGNKG